MNSPESSRNGAGVSAAAGSDNRPRKTLQSALGIVEVSGPDALEFVHAQLSADCRALATGASVLTAWCSPKGRVLFLPRVVRAESAVLLLLPRTQIDSFLKRLRMFVLRAAVTIEDRSESHGVIRCDHLARAEHRTDAVSGRDRDQQWFVTSLASVPALWDALEAASCSEAEALLTDIRLGVPELDAALTDQFLPQELNLDQHAGVSFNKGCYPGQEIIARVRFRGSVKRRLARFIGSGIELPGPGLRLLDEQGNAAGTVLMSAHADGDSFELLAVVNIEGVTAVTLAAGLPPLERAPLEDAIVD